MLKNGFPLESVVGKEAAGVEETGDGGVKPKTGASSSGGPPLHGRRALSQAQRDMIKGGAIISRARRGHFN